MNLDFLKNKQLKTEELKEVKGGGFTIRTPDCPPEYVPVNTGLGWECVEQCELNG